MHDARYERQTRLKEVGEAGQRKIEKSRMAVGRSASAEVEILYLERAGVGALVRSEDVGHPFEHGDLFEHGAARDYGAAAWRALGQLRAVLEA